MSYMRYDLVGRVVVTDITIGEGRPGFSWFDWTMAPKACYHCDVFVLLRHDAAKMSPATHYALQHITASVGIMKI